MSALQSIYEQLADLMAAIDGDHMRGIGEMRSAPTVERLARLKAGLRMLIDPPAAEVVLPDPIPEDVLRQPLAWMWVNELGVTRFGTAAPGPTLSLVVTALYPPIHPPRRYRHTKTGGIYELLARGLREVNREPMVIYRSMSDGETWMRPAAQFDDGRFEEVA